MAENGCGPTPVVGHIGRIPNFGKTQVNQFGNTEPPACIQNAMMTKDKKPFTYTPGGLDLSQIRTPSMARRMARQRSLEDQDQGFAQGNGNSYHPQGGPAPPPPPPMKIPAPPPPPPLVIEAPNNKSPKPALGERPEIVIPENPIGMLRKTNSPYHWEAEKADLQRMGPVPKFIEKVPSPLTVKLPQNNIQQSYGSPQSNYQRQNTYGNQYQSPDSPLHRPEAQYANKTNMSTGINGSPPTREFLQRQDSQFNKSPQPFGNQSPLVTSTPYSPTPNNNWRQPERRDSPAKNSPQSPQINRGPFSPNIQQSPPVYNQVPQNNKAFHTLPRVGQRNQENVASNIQNNYASPIANNVREVPQQNEVSNVAPWRTNTLNRYPKQNQQTTFNNIQNESQAYSPPWKGNETNNNRPESNFNSPWKRDNQNASQANDRIQNNPSWVSQQTNKAPDTYSVPWRSQESERSAPTSPPETRYQSSISIPISPRKQASQPEYNNSPSQKEVVYVNEEPVFYCPESPKAMPPWVKSQKEKTKTPPPIWCQRPLDGTKTVPRELETPPRDTNQEPEWVRKSTEMQRGAREVVSPPKYQQSAQPNWSTRPSENRKSLPRDNMQQQQPSSRIIPIQMEVSNTETRNQRQQGNQQPQLRIVIDMNQNPNSQTQSYTQAPYSQPTQRIMRVLSPQLIKLDEGSADRDLPSLNRSFQSQDSQPKTRIIPIQVEGGNSNKRVYYHKIAQDEPQRQSRSFKVLQVVTGTGPDDIQIIEDGRGYSDL